MFRVKPLSIDGCYLLTPTVLMETSCDLIKLFNENQFSIYGLSTDFKEEYYAIAKPGVLRGLHYQMDPEGHDKLVSCISGAIIDIIVDIREGSKTYGRYELLKLNEENRNLVYIPKGCAHGYYVEGSKESLVFYKVTKPFNINFKSGINWESFGISNKLNINPKISDDDKKLPILY